MMKSKKGRKKKGSKELYAYYMELDSPLDLARQASSYEQGNINAIKSGGAYRLMANGERFGDLRVIYYSNIEKIANFLIYNPGSDSKEIFEMKNAVMGGYDFKSYKFPVMELMSDPYKEARDFKKADRVIKIQVKSPDSLVKSTANYAREEESVPRLYAFFHGNEHIIGTFDLFHESSARIFTYAITDKKEKFGALSYNYTDDTIEPVNSFVDKSVVYIRVINLKKPFPFF
jgi:hypothetical protein